MRDAQGAFWFVELHAKALFVQLLFSSLCIPVAYHCYGPKGLPGNMFFGLP